MSQKPSKETLEAVCWDLPPHAACSPDCAPSHYHLFRSMAHGLPEQLFQSLEDVEKWVKEWIELEDEALQRHGIHILSEIWGKVMANDGQYFD
ncbi:hypothetical protein ANCDUO_02787 [Ancylostoma duodenale]|uniref:Uncharacterized protein n=1 Tax=Ancylostoma duodenale TaxID=51022 RepID=A0A0C2DVL3_9BILA|nr:hypothetical protein ANCDUO_02787 [Ancylostoma duodenale]